MTSGVSRLITCESTHAAERATSLCGSGEDNIVSLAHVPQQLVVKMGDKHDTMSEGAQIDYRARDEVRSTAALHAGSIWSESM